MALMPPDLVEDAVREANATTVNAAKGDIKQDRAGALRAILSGFADLTVTQADLEVYLGHELETVTPEEITDLRAVFMSLRDGNSVKGDYFDPDGKKSDPVAADADLREQVTKTPDEKATSEAPSEDGELFEDSGVPAAS